MNHVEYLIEQLEAKVNELTDDIVSEDVMSANGFMAKAYKQGKKDAYSFVLCALEEGLKAEREELEDQKKKYDEFMNSIEKRGSK